MRLPFIVLLYHFSFTPICIPQKPTRIAVVRTHAYFPCTSRDLFLSNGKNDRARNRTPATINQLDNSSQKDTLEGKPPASQELEGGTCNV
jgi:hypothetical protein